jgi:hypothetical protein
VTAVEVGRRDAVLDGRLGEAKLIDKDVTSVGTGDSRETVEEDRDVLVGVEVGLDGGEGEDGLEERGVGLDRVDNLDGDGAESGGADSREVNLWAYSDQLSIVGEVRSRGRTSGRSISL